MSRVNLPARESFSPAEIEREVVCAYHLHAAELVQYATSVARSADVARDAVQEVFLRYFIERRCGRAIERPRAWLFQVLRNHLSHLRSNAAGEPLPDTIESVLDQNQDPERNIAGSELARQVALTLTPRELDCLRLRAQGFGYQEIAALLGIRSGTVGALLSRASRKLRPAGEDGAAVFELADALRVLCLNHHEAGDPLALETQ